MIKTAESNNYFKKLYAIDVSDKVKQKNGLSYVPWAVSWAELKKQYPDASYYVYENLDGRPWFDDGKTAWVKVNVTIEDITHTEYLSIMTTSNRAMPIDNVTSTDVVRSIQRALTKACARHGVGLYVYEGEDLPEERQELIRLQNECIELINRKCALSESAKAKVGEICKAASPESGGNPAQIENSEVLKALRKQLAAIRK